MKCWESNKLQKSSYQVIRKRCQIYFFNVKLVCKNILFNNGRELFVGLCSLRFTSVLLDHSQHSFGFGFRIWNSPNINCICWVSEKGEVWYVSCVWWKRASSKNMFSGHNKHTLFHLLHTCTMQLWPADCHRYWNSVKRYWLGNDETEKQCNDIEFKINQLNWYRAQ